MELNTEEANSASTHRHQAQSELTHYLQTRDERRRMFPRAMLVGLLAGLLSVAFRAAISFADFLRSRLVEVAHHLPFGLLIVIGVAMIGGSTAVFLVRRFAPEAAGAGIPHLEAVLHRYRTLNWKRVIPIKYVGGIFALGSGLVMGREGPSVQMGGSVGIGVGQLMRLSERESLVLAASGAGAGLAAAFNAPLAGLIFVLEELQKDFRPLVFGAAFIAAATADVVSRVFNGVLPAFSAPAYPSQPIAALPAFAITGVLAGLLGAMFNRSLMKTLNFAAFFQRYSAVGYAAAITLVIGIGSYFAPDFVGGGHEVAERALAGKMLLVTIPLLLAGRFVLTIVSYSTGAPGGIFAPLLVLGSLLGLGMGHLVHLTFPGLPIDPGAFAVVGMAAYFTAIVRAPLTGIVLILEMTQSYSQMISLLVTCFCAYAVAEALGDLPIYEGLLQRDLATLDTPIHHGEPIVLELELQPGAPFVGKEVRGLGLPAGVVLIQIRVGSQEFVPVAATLLEAHQRITAVISPSALDGVERFRSGMNG